MTDEKKTEEEAAAGLAVLFDGPSTAWFKCPDHGPFQAEAEDGDMTAWCMHKGPGDEFKCGTESPRFTCGVCASRNDETGTCFNPDKCNKPLEDPDPVFGNGAPVVPGKLVVQKSLKGCRHFEVRPTKAEADKWHPDNMTPKPTFFSASAAYDVEKTDPIKDAKAIIIDAFTLLDEVMESINTIRTMGVDMDDTDIQRDATLTMANLYHAKGKMFDISDNLVKNGGD